MALTRSGGILACGGQKGELYLCDLPQTGKIKPKAAMKPFSLNLTLPSRSINNAITILPSWPRGWLQRRGEWKRAYAGYARGRDDDLCDSDDELDEEAEAEDVEPDVNFEIDEYMDILDDYDDEVATSPASSVATYPNTIPFGLPRRMSRHGEWQRPQYVTRGGGGRHSPASTTSSKHMRPDEPRILVSNNDKSVKMFSLRRLLADREALDERAPPRERLTSAHGEGWDAWAPAMSALRRTVDGADTRYRALESTLGSRAPEDVALRGTRYLGESISDYRARNPGGDDRDERRIWQMLRAERAAELERRIGLVSNPDGEACKLSSIGGQRFKLAVNHSSLSPDLRTMVTVGDSTDVYLHEVIDGGARFRPIGIYNAATDSGFSTSWSKDGRRFAVASQDGQVTVWDHRSSRPLAIFHTQPQGNARYSDFDERAMDPPVGSQSGLEAARVVKFSPEGSSRDLLVFSEELTRIHIVDARTFQTHMYIEVPFDAAGVPPSPSRRPRRGVDGGLYGISGIAFDPTGDWLYAGTERTVVEWDLRRYGGGEGGTWSMA